MPFRGPFRDIAVHAVLLRTGKMLLFFGNPTAYVWDPATGDAVEVDTPMTLFCAGHVVLPDGRVLVVGGWKPGSIRESGPPWVFTFDPDTLEWTRWADMRQGRYYPTVSVLPDGRALITNGKTEAGGHSFDEDLEVFDPATNTLSLVGSQHIGLYAHQAVLPDGRVFVAGGTGNKSALLIDPADWSTTMLPSMQRTRTHGGGFLMPGDTAGSWKYMVTGGDYEATTEYIDLSDPQPVWRWGPDLPQPRAYMNTVLLPDGSVVGVGGDALTRSARSRPTEVCLLGEAADMPAQTPVGTAPTPHRAPDDPQHGALLLGPSSDTWAPAAIEVKARTYHSTATLLPDGRVLAAGGTGPGNGGDTLEIYSPPYLFRGPRPAITSVPTTLSYGTRFGLAATQDIVRVVLMRPGATTHTNHMDQRHIELDVSSDDGRVKVTAPTDANLAPPGHHLLFGLNALGVPSEATWVHLS